VELGTGKGVERGTGKGVGAWNLVQVKLWTLVIAPFSRKSTSEALRCAAHVMVFAVSPLHPLVYTLIAFPVEAGLHITDPTGMED